MNKMINVGERKEPSKTAIDQFIQVYMEIVKNLKVQPAEIQNKHNR